MLDYPTMLSRFIKYPNTIYYTHALDRGN